VARIFGASTCRPAAINSTRNGRAGLGVLHPSSGDSFYKVRYGMDGRTEKVSSAWGVFEIEKKPVHAREAIKETLGRLCIACGKELRRKEIPSKSCVTWRPDSYAVFWHRSVSSRKQNTRCTKTFKGAY
jgi:hypothetical protein